MSGTAACAGDLAENQRRGINGKEGSVSGLSFFERRNIMTNMKEVLREVKERMGDHYEVYSEEIGKNNGLMCQAVTIREHGSRVAPSIHADSLLEKIESEEISVQEAAAAITGVYWEKYSKEGFADIKNCISKEFILDRVIYQIVNKEKNANRLKKMPHKTFLDLAAAYRVIWKEEDSGMLSKAVTDEFCSHYSISQDELDAAARRNTEQRGFCVHSMASLLKELICMPEDVEEAPMWVITNPGKFYGAAVMLYEEYFSDLSGHLENDLYILPSSIHEVIVVPANVFETDFLKEMVREVNASEVAAEEVLSENVYRYSREDGMLLTA